MAARLCLLTFLVIFSVQICNVDSHPMDFLRKFSSGLVTESGRGWLWGWAWVWGDSTVSIVDRTPPLNFISRPAAFGAQLSDPLLGYVIPLNSFTVSCGNSSSDIDLTSPNLGCPRLCISGPNEPERMETWIALVQRGKCQFVDKVREAQRLGANAVVVGGDDPDISGYPDTLVNMYSPDDSSDVSIAATFIKYSDYMELSALIAVSNTTHSGLRTLSLLITTDYSALEWYYPILTFAIIILLPSSLTLLTLLIHRFRAARAAQRDRAPEDIVKSLPSRVWTGVGLEKSESAIPGPNSLRLSEDIDLEQGATPKSTDSADPSTSSHVPVQPWHELQVECAICLSDFVKGDTVRVLPCHHIFHLDEIDGWLIHRKKLCPVCKADVTHPAAKYDPLKPFSMEEADSTTTHAGTSPSRPSASERTPLLPPPHSP